MSIALGMPARGDMDGKNSWKLQGRCRVSKYPDRWYSNNRSEQLEAKRICSGCEVKERCLEEALAKGDIWGVWGGMNQSDRREVIRERKRAQAAAAATQAADETAPFAPSGS